MRKYEEERLIVAITTGGDLNEFRDLVTDAMTERLEIQYYRAEAERTKERLRLAHDIADGIKTGPVRDLDDLRYRLHAVTAAVDELVLKLGKLNDTLGA